MIMGIAFWNIRLVRDVTLNPFRKDYEYFLTLSSELNISKAAEKIGVQQAGLSKALKNLEYELGKELFYRTNRGLKLTPYGSLLRKNLISTIDHWDLGVEEDQERLLKVQGKFQFGMHPTLALNFSPKFLPNICEGYPDIDLEMVLRNSSEVTRDVIEHKIHFGIAVNPEKHADLIIQKLDEEFIACWSREEKKHEKVLYYNPDMIEIARKLRNFKQYKKIPIQDYEVIAANMKTAKGIALLPSSVIGKYPFLKQVGGTMVKAKICLIYRYDIQRSRAFDVVLDEIKKGLSS